MADKVIKIPRVKIVSGSPKEIQDQINISLDNIEKALNKIKSSQG